MLPSLTERLDLPQLFVGGLISYLHYLHLFAYHIVVSNTYSVVLLFCSSSSCVPNVASISGLSIFDCLFGIL